MLAIIDGNKFNYKNRIGEFKYIEIKHLVNNIRKNTISEIDAKKSLNILNEIKNAEIIKYKRHTPKQKELLNLFNDLLDTILTDKKLKSKSQNDKTLMSSNEDDNNDKILMSSNENNNNDKTLMSSNEDNENGKTLMSSTDDDDNENDKTLISSTDDDDDDDDETMNQNNNDIIKQLNNHLHEITDKSKSFEE